MSETEIALARAYLETSGHDPVTALIRSVRDLTRTRNLVSPGYVRGKLPGPRLHVTIDEQPWEEVTQSGAAEH